MKKLLSLCLSALMMLQITPSLSFADDNSQSQLENQEMYKYEDIINMTDEEFIKAFPDSKYVAAGFGDDTLSFKEKLDNCYYPDFQIAGECEFTMLILHGRIPSMPELNKHYIEVEVSRYNELDPEFDPSVIGLPADWETELEEFIEREFYDENGNEFIQRRQVHRYKIYIPDEVFESFETFSRFDKALQYHDAMIETEEAQKYGITFITDVFIELLVGRDSTEISNIYGDANMDYEVNLADSVLVMQYFANPAKYLISKSGKSNADMDGDGFNIQDAFIIQKKILNADK